MLLSPNTFVGRRVLRTALVLALGTENTGASVLELTGPAT